MVLRLQNYCLLWTWYYCCRLLPTRNNNTKNTKNTETKLKSKCFQIQWVYSFIVFFFNPSEWLWSYRRNSYHEYVIIVDLFHLLGITIQKLQKIRNQTEIKMFWNPMGLQFLCFLSLTPLNGYEVTGKIPNINISYCWPMSPTRNDNTKIEKIQKPNWNQKVLKSNGFTVFVFIFFNTTKWFWRHRKNT